VDSFPYTAPNGDIKHLTEADADYFIIGWNSLSKHDLLVGRGDSPLRAAFDEMKLALDVDALKATSDEKSHIRSILNTSGDSRSLLHGAVYSVKYRLNSKPRSLADEAGAKFTPEFKMEPLSVGTTALDSVITFLEAHTKDDIEKVFGQGTGDAASAILSMSELLYAADDSYSERVKAQDLFLYANNFAKSQSAGSVWAFGAKAETGKAPKVPTPGQMTTLITLNEKQANLDVMLRKLEMRRWDLFSEWWKYVSDKSNISSTIQTQYAGRVQALKLEILDLETRTATLQSDLDTASKDQPFKKANQPAFYTRKDPTLCIAGIDSGWPTDFMDSVNVRLERQIADAPADLAATIFGTTAHPLPTEMQSLATKILSESVSKTANPDGTYATTKGSQDWGNANPFAPMFVEWEATYYHIDRSKWTVGVRPSPVGHAHSQVRYGVNEFLPSNPQNQVDFRTLSGRTLILPQPVFSLEAAIKDMLDSNDPRMTLTKEQVIKVQNNVRNFKFISSPLAGITEHLLTKYMGTHVKPSISHQGKTPVPLGPAITASVDIGFTEDILRLINTAE
jgi:hypothetical protein